MLIVMKSAYAMKSEASGTGGFPPPNFPVAAGAGDGDYPDSCGDFIVILTEGRYDICRN